MAWPGGGVLGRLLAAVLLVVACGVVRAAQADMTLSTSDAQRCLSPPLAERVKPAYPEEMLRIKRGASIDADFTFSGPGSAPSVHFEEEPAFDFRAAIETYARQLRVPCMAPGGAKVTLKQGFDFKPNDGRKVSWTTPTDSDDPARQAQVHCIVYNRDRLPTYPDAMASAGREGTVVVRLRFTAPDKSPQIEILDNGGSRHFAGATTGYMEDMRMPCVGAAPIETMFYFHFQFTDGSPSKRVLKDSDLPAFLAAVRPIAPGSAYFDTVAMKCPFDVRLTFKQPYELNRIEELETDVPARHAFLDWLAQLQIDINPKAANSLLGQTMAIHVPCVLINL